MQRLWIAFVLLSSGIVMAGCGAEDSIVAADAVERSGYYAEVDAKTPQEQAVLWAYAGHVVEMEKVLARDKTLVNVVVGDYTPLTAALAAESRDMVNFLLDHGADPNLETTQGSPLAVAVRADVDSDIIDALKAHGAK